MESCRVSGPAATGATAACRLWLGPNVGLSCRWLTRQNGDPDACSTALPKPLLEIPPMDDAVDQDDMIRIQDLVEDAVVADPQA